ncbi:hypothetical protein [Gemella sanguinis]|uniref:hypothetical protein n=1 Tax=Gemella sanguinis TaxID=84135 RepID=UPI0004E28B1D|nr:hypothetical protein [Gemella sanguinis]NKZ26528.1 hypothetical protein [Gemella sanguinis]
MKDMKSIIGRIILAFIAFIVIITIYGLKGKTGEDERKIRLEEERIAEYTIQNYKDVKKIEFKSFEKNSSTQTWVISAVINDNISVSYSLFKIGENKDIGISYNPNELKKRTKDEQNIKDKSNVEIIYK